MSLTPLLHSTPAIQIHLATALLAMLIGGFALFRPRRDRIHRILGRIWVAFMAVVAISSFFISAAVGPKFAGFGLIHLLSVVVLVSLVAGLRAVWRGDYKAHAKTMKSLYVQALGITGALTLLPGRLLNEVFFAALPELGYVAIALGAVLIWRVLRSPSKFAARS